MTASKLPAAIFRALILDSEVLSGKKNRLIPAASKQIERPMVRKLVRFRISYVPVCNVCLVQETVGVVNVGDVGINPVQVVVETGCFVVAVLVFVVEN